jgi:hypothetical protein
MATTRIIGPFRGELRWLSNFFPAPVTLDGMTFPTVEHAYQAAKTLHEAEREMIRDLPTPGRAKRASRHLTLRPDWQEVKLAVMEDLLRQKFADAQLRRLLLDTSPHLIVELNRWGDVFWGVCKGRGENHLGRILMRLRDGAEEH